MGEVVFWTIIRAAVTIIGLWIIRSQVDSQLWWFIAIAAVYVLVIHPAIVSYRWFETRNKKVLESTLCSSCKSFDPSAVLCIKYDKHPTENYVPCDGVDWEPQ
jgi:glucan phosphoethanolaminetransferase (alkaline phosphatase superfamily)